MRLPTITTRRMMVLVAVVAIPLGLRREIEARRAHARAMAAYHRSSIVGALLISVGIDGTGRGYGSWRPGNLSQPLTTRERFSDSWHFSLLDKYERSERLLWPSVEPDPPEPNWPATLPANPRTPPWLLAGLLATERLGWQTRLFQETRSWIYHLRCGRVYQGLIAAGDPNISFCRKQAAHHNELARHHAELARRLILQR